MSTILEVKNLEVFFNTYAGRVEAVRDVSFHLASGETLVVVGESGCGKTVMSKSIMGLLPRDISEIGEDSQISYLGENILKLKKKDLEKFRGREISMIFQDPMTYLNPTMKIGNQIAESLIIHENISRREALKKTEEILNMVGIPNARERIGQYPHEFSGGMRQRVIIAIALACNPKILIADEPTTALDVTTQADIIDLILDLQEELGMAIIMITHDLGIAAEIADRIQVMYAGEIIESGSREDIFKNPQHPYTLGLLRSVPDISDNSRLYSLGGSPPDLIVPPKGCAFASRCDYCMEVCKKHRPKIQNISEEHSVKCWLKHPYAENVKRPEGLKPLKQGGGHNG